MQNTKNQFYVLTGKIKSGKSTSIQNWTKNLKKVGGIIQLQKDGKRFLLDISTEEKRELTSVKNKKSLKVGKYFFDNSVIQWGKEVLFRAVRKNVGWLIFDEYGIGEFENECFEPEISELFSSVRKANTETKILIVVRENLIERFLKKFHGLDFTVIRSVNDLIAN